MHHFTSGNIILNKLLIQAKRQTGPEKRFLILEL